MARVPIVRDAIVMALGAAGVVLAADAPPHVRLEDIPWVTSPSEVPTRVEGESGSGRQVQVRVARIHRSGDKTHASVHLQNTSSFEFHDITVSCTAFDVQGRSIDTRRASFTREQSGRLRPGFVSDLDLVFDTPGAEVRALSCDAHGRGMPTRVD